MKQCVLIASVAALLVGCAAMPQRYNGVVGYQVEQQDAHSAILSYTVAKQSGAKITEPRLNYTCQQVLGADQQYQVKMLTQQEIVNTVANQSVYGEGVELGNSGVKVGFTNAPSLHNSEGYATKEMLSSKPRTLLHVRYLCQTL